MGRDERRSRSQFALDHREAQALHRAQHVTPPLRTPGAHPSATSCDGAASRRPPWHPICGQWPPPTSRWSGTSATTTLCLSSWPGRTCPGWPVWAPRVPDHFLRTKIRPLVRRCSVPSRSVEAYVERLGELHARVPGDYAAYYRRHADGTHRAMRGADPAIILVPGVGMFAFGKDKQTARVAAEFYVNAINVMRGAETISSYSPIDESEKFRVEYWELEEAKLRRLPRPASHDGRVALVTGGASGIGQAIATALAASGACVLVADLDIEKSSAGSRRTRRRPMSAVGVAVDVSARKRSRPRQRTPLWWPSVGIDLLVNCAGLSVSKPLLETTEADWDIQHDVMAKGSFLMSKAAARIMIDQGVGGDIVYICSKNAVFAGPNNIAYSAAKADQAHQVRLLAAELGTHGIRVNGINPDGVVQGSGIFAGGWGADRAAVYGVAEEELGSFYAKRTLLGHEVLPEHVAEVAVALTSANSATRPGPSSPSTAVSLPPSCAEACRPGSSAPWTSGASGGRVIAGLVEEAGSRCGACTVFPNAPVRRRRRCTGTSRRSSPRCSTASAARARSTPRSSPSGSTRGASTTRCSTRRRAAGGSALLPRRRTSGAWTASTHGSTGPSSTPSTASSSCPSPRCTSWPPSNRGPCAGARRHVVLLPDLLCVLAHRHPGHRGHQRVDDGPPRRPPRGHGHRSWRRCSGRSSTLPGAAPAGEPARTVTPRSPQPTGLDPSVVVATVGSHDTASAVAAVPALDDAAPTSRAAPGPWSGWSWMRPCSPRQPVRRTSPTSLGSTRGFVSCATSAGSGSCDRVRSWTWKAHGLNADLTALLDQAVQIPAGTWVIDVEDPAFLSPGGHAREGSRRPPKGPVRGHPTLPPRSFAAWWIPWLRRTPAPPAGAAELSATAVDVLHVVGGGVAQPPPVPGHGGRCGPPGGRRPGRGDSTRQRSGPGTGSWGSRKLAQRRQNDDLHEHGVPEVPTAMILCQNLKPTWLTTSAEIICDSTIGLGSAIIEDLAQQGHGWLQNHRPAHHDLARRIGSR